MTATDLRAFIERETPIRHWAQDYQVTPRLCSKVFGDGKQFIILYPMMFRPNHFIVRIDSRMGTTRDAFYDLLDDIYEALEEEHEEELLTRYFGEAYTKYLEWKYGDQDEPEPEETFEPMFDGGSVWGNWKRRDMVKEYAEWRQAT